MLQTLTASWSLGQLYPDIHLNSYRVCLQPLQSQIYS
jgi:hypothetical protein